MQAGDYILSQYIEKYGEDLFLELEQVQIDEALGAIQEGIVTGEVDGVDSSAEVQVGTPVPQAAQDGEEE